MSLRDLAARWTPPALKSALRPTLSGRHGLPTFEDGFPSWNAAAAASTGYDDRSILEQSLAAAKAVRSGGGAFERDGVVFTDPEVRWPLAVGVLFGAAARQNPVVVDIGGGLASTWWQHRELFSALPGLQWIVVEQPEVCIAGRSLGDDGVSYRERLDEALQLEPATVLLSSSLQYLPEPAAVLRQCMATGAVIVIDRTPMRSGPDDLPCVQHVPASIYSGSYPVWVLSAPHLDGVLRDGGYRVLARFPGIEPEMRTSSGLPFTWEGLIASRAA